MLSTFSFKELISIFLLSHISIALANVSPAEHRQTLDTHNLDLSNTGKNTLTNDIVKGDSGYYWLATHKGLLRYDGHNFKQIYSKPDDLLFNRAVTQLLKIEHHIWLLTSNRLFRLNTLNYKLDSYPEFNNMEVTIHSDLDTIWLTSSDSMIYGYQAKTNTFIQALESRSIQTKTVNDIKKDHNGLVWVSTNLGLIPYHLMGSALVKAQLPQHWPAHLNKLKFQAVGKTLIGREGIIWLNSLGKIYQLGQDYTLKQEVLLPCHKEKRCEVSHWGRGQKGEIWAIVNGKKVISLSDKKLGLTGYQLKPRRSLKSKADQLNSLDITDTGEILFSTKNSLIVARTPGSKTSTELIIPTKNKTDQREKNATKKQARFYPDFSYLEDNNSIWLVQGKQLHNINLHTKAWRSFKLPLPAKNIAVDRLGAVWFIHKNTLHQFDPVSESISKPVSHRVTSLIYSRLDGLWIRDENHDWMKLNPQNLSSTKYHHPLCSNTPFNTEARLIKDQRLAWPQGDGICEYNRASNSFIMSSVTGLNNSISAKKLYHLDEQYWYLLTNTNSLQATSKNSIKPLTWSLKKPIQLNTISPNIITDKKNLWGLDHQRNRLYRIDTKNSTLNYFDSNSGILIDQKTQLLAINQQGKLVLAKPGRIILIDTNKLKKITDNSRFKIHSISFTNALGVDEIIYKTPKKISLSGNSNRLQVNLGNTYPQLSETYYYRLLGSEVDWNETQLRLLKFPKISIGSYLLQAKPSINSKQIVSLEIEVKPPLWQQWWAYLAYVILLLIIASYYIRKKIKSNKELNYQVNFDELTKLPNRNQAKQIIEDGIKKNRILGIMVLSLDSIKTDADILSYHNGSQILRVIADKLEHALGPSDELARLGRNEFIVICKKNENDSLVGITATAEALLLTTKDMIHIKNKSVFITLSIGISLYPKHGDNNGKLLRNADTAVQAAKILGGNYFCYYSKKLNKDSIDNQKKEAELYQAIKNGEFVPYYQPKVDACSKQYVGFEVLARWEPPNKGTIFPIDFMALAEKTGGIIELSWKLLHQVCFQLECWSEAGISLPVAINISPKQLSLRNFADQVREIIRQYQISPQLIQFEITESTLLQHKGRSVRQLKVLRDRGHKIIVDDFGTSFSPLWNLKELPIDVLKLDQSFVKNLLYSKDQQNMVTTITDLAKKMKLELVAEGVEDSATAEYLLSLGCRISQGYYYCAPLPAQEIDELLFENMEQA